jgi:hypothetical protein
MEAQLASETSSCYFKKLDDGQSPKKKTLSVNFSHAMFSLLSTHDNLVMQALVWIHMMPFRAIRFGAVWCSISYANLRDATSLSTKFKGKTSSCIQVNMVLANFLADQGFPYGQSLQPS